MEEFILKYRINVFYFSINKLPLHSLEQTSYTSLKAAIVTIKKPRRSLGY